MNPTGKWFHSIATIAVAAATTLFGMPARAECFDTTKHLRGGQWHQWVLQITPGPQAQSKVEQIIQEINAQRSRGDVPPLLYEGEPLAFGVIDENNARGPNGEPLKTGRRIRKSFSRRLPACRPGNLLLYFSPIRFARTPI